MSLSAMRRMNGAVFDVGGEEWVFELDEESRWAGYIHTACGVAVRGEDGMCDHECRRCTDCQSVLHEDDWPADVTVCDDCLDKREERLDTYSQRLAALRREQAS